jgi:hypothetical protein
VWWFSTGTKREFTLFLHFSTILHQVKISGVTMCCWRLIRGAISWCCVTKGNVCLILCCSMFRVSSCKLLLCIVQLVACDYFVVTCFSIQPVNTTMTILKHITKTSLLISYEQLCIQSYYYYRQHIPEQSTGENNSMYQLFLDPHITSPPAVHTDQYSDTTTS